MYLDMGQLLLLGCDTFVALPPSTKYNVVVFGKNSDRPSEEVQEVVYIPAKDFKSGEKLQCTYIEIDQADHTNAVILSKPAWMWGAEMGANEYGVVVGNEAVWTTLCDQDNDIQERLLGMDLLRLALERSKTARQAVNVTTALLEKHGQGGPCAEDLPRFTYHNSFLFADRQEAWVLETAGQHWAAERVDRGVRNISNNLTITTKVDLCSHGLNEAAKKEGWNGVSELNFGNTFSASGRAKDQSRQIDGERLLQKFSATGIGLREMMSVLRDQRSGICMGRGGGFTTTGSQVSVLPLKSEQPCFHFFTGTPDPCVSGFKPFVFCGESTKSSPLLESPRFPVGKDPATSVPRFQYSVDRRHELHKFHDKALSSQNCSAVTASLQKLEDSRIDQVEKLLTGGNTVADNHNFESLLLDAANAEMELFKS